MLYRTVTLLEQSRESIGEEWDITVVKCISRVGNEPARSLADVFLTLSLLIARSGEREREHSRRPPRGRSANADFKILAHVIANTAINNVKGKTILRIMNER